VFVLEISAADASFPSSFAFAFAFVLRVFVFVLDRATFSLGVVLDVAVAVVVLLIPETEAEEITEICWLTVSVCVWRAGWVAFCGVAGERLGSGHEAGTFEESVEVGGEAAGAV
jgi:hypothetical protein